MADGAALFHADHKNLAGSGAAISVTSLGAARTAMRLQTGINGAILNIVPRYLIVPAALESDAETILAALARPDQSNPGVANAEFIRNLELVVDPRLDADSATAWYFISVGSIDGFHDRYVIVDGRSCYQTGASFKDGAKKSPTTLTEITDAFEAVSETYENPWAAAKVDI